MEPLRDGEVTGTRAETRGREVDVEQVEAVLPEFPRPWVAWSEGGTTLVAGGAAATVSADGADRFESVRESATALFADWTVDPSLPHAARPRLFGGFAFHEGERSEADSPWEGFPDACFVLPAVAVVADEDGRTWLVANAVGADAGTVAEDRLDEWARRLDGADLALDAERPGIRSRAYEPDRAGWREQITAAIDRIERGDLRKVVLARALSVELERPLSVPAAYARLGETYPDCYRFLFAPDSGGSFFGATPERLVTRDGRAVRTEALAGSIGRGDTPAEDEWLARQLQESDKDVHEHELVVEAIREQLAPYGSVSVGDRTVRRLASVQHLRTPIAADLDEDHHVLSLVEALHPTPAVGGLPPGAALETIRETEAFDRGWYASPVGWFDAAGNGTFAVGLRSAIADGTRARLYAGNGIVADSDPDREWGEVLLKCRPVLDTLERGDA